MMAETKTWVRDAENHKEKPENDIGIRTSAIYDHTRYNEGRDTRNNCSILFNCTVILQHRFPGFYNQKKKSSVYVGSYQKKNYNIYFWFDSSPKYLEKT